MKRSWREMRDAAGDSGEFYTPRPVVRFMVEALDPQLGETVLDPACGTGGFLCEAFQHLEPHADTVEKRRVFQQETLIGGEAKSLPFLLAQLNLLLHGLHAPRIDSGNALRFRLSEIGEGQRGERDPDQSALRAASLALGTIAMGPTTILFVTLKQIAADFGWPRAGPSMASALMMMGSGVGWYRHRLVDGQAGGHAPGLVRRVYGWAGRHCRQSSQRAMGFLCR